MREYCRGDRHYDQWSCFAFCSATRRANSRKMNDPTSSGDGDPPPHDEQAVSLPMAEEKGDNTKGPVPSLVAEEIEERVEINPRTPAGQPALCRELSK